MTETLLPATGAPAEQPAAPAATHPLAVLVQRLAVRLDEAGAGPAP